MRSLYGIKGYLAVIPHIQNIYPPERIEVGWQFGFKYTSGIFESFVYKTKEEAVFHHSELATAINNYYITKRGEE